MESVQPTSEAAEKTAWERLDQLTKPPRSLGRLEEIAARVARIQQTDHPSVERKAILLMAGDHGVVAEGVSPFPQDVTWQMVANFVSGGAAINQLAASVGAEVRIYDVGIVRDVDLPGVEVRKVGYGTGNMVHGPAMSREDCAKAVLVGVEAAREAAQEGVTLLGTGEMGIGNSTAAAALAAVFTNSDPVVVVGRGTGLDDAGVVRKAGVIRAAFEQNNIAELDVLGVLAAVGGFEIAALAGVVIGAAEEGVCVVSDGFISGAATLAAVALCPNARDYVFPSHLSVEPGHRVVLDALGFEPVLELDMRLGEGTGAALAMGIIDAACRMMSGMVTFAEAGVSGAE
ncbi:MAG: nicotinate-nucleotide--dimethylbenzimidazole phosphoribosyltransferase [Actinobacteria bacterium HGW-Actinobacteria-7]|nr:MAG: nicotinate-nucleotide--dimethylbenzimidazole phosphoribosyltransferase [Actinobacteria bacterium HGW-Actinobacteria-7]